MPKRPPITKAKAIQRTCFQQLVWVILIDATTDEVYVIRGNRAFGATKGWINTEDIAAYYDRPI